MLVFLQYYSSLVITKMELRASFLASCLLILLSIEMVFANNYYNNRMPQQQQRPKSQAQINPVGFVGGPDADVTVMSMYHLLRRFLAYVVFKQGRGQHFTQRNNHFVLNEIQCLGGCPRTAFCDMGICRCYKGMMALHGTCWKQHEGVIEDAANWELKKQQSLITVPHQKPCSSHRTCHEIDINLICRYDTRKCACRETMRWNPDKFECQVFIPVECPKIVNGTVVEEEDEENEETEEEEVEEIEQISREMPGRYDQQLPINGRYDQQVPNRFDQVPGRFDQQRYGGDMMRNRQMDYNGVRRRHFGINNEKNEESEEEEEREEEEPKADELMKLNPYTMNEFEMKEAFCHDMTILYKNYTSDDEGHHYFFAPFKSTPMLVAIFILFSIIIAGACFYAFVHTNKTEKFLRKSFKAPKRVDTPPEFHDIDDSDDDTKANHSNSSRPNNNQNNVRLFSTPQHNPNNPFNATPQGTPSRRPPVKHR